MKAFLVDLENKPGALAAVAEALGEKGVNITGVSGTTCGDGGRVAITAEDEAITRTTLGAIGARFDEIEVVEATLRHEPGSLGTAARRLAGAGVNIEAILPTGMSGSDVSVAFATDNPAKAREILATVSSGAR
jgi:hypothetical protein